jgi:hypothetical protein
MKVLLWGYPHGRAAHDADGLIDATADVDDLDGLG